MSDPHVVILVDGLGSLSADPHLAPVGQCIEKAGFARCGFSYNEVGTPYRPRHTLRRFNELVALLDEHVSRYSLARSLVLVGYSFGGLVVSEWLYRHRHDIDSVSAFAGAALIASPVRLGSVGAYYKRDPSLAGQPYLFTMLRDYTAKPEKIPGIAPLAVFRCEHDGLIPDDAFTYSDLPKEDRPLEEIVIKAVEHETILNSRHLRTHLLRYLKTVRHEPPGAEKSCGDGNRRAGQAMTR